MQRLGTVLFSRVVARPKNADSLPPSPRSANLVCASALCAARSSTASTRGRCSAAACSCLASRPQSERDAPRISG
eukprot:6213202-Pleurochrysis_carterae.AAC.2